MNLIDFLKNKRKQLLDASKNVTPTTNEPKEPNIEIIIEDDTSIFANEPEIILKSAKEFLEIGSVSSLEEGVIICATMIRGLKYRRTERDEFGNIKIFLKDIALDNNPKVL